MSASLKFKEKNHYNEGQIPESQDKVDVNDLVSRMKKEEKKERKNNIMLSAAAISAVAVFGIILTL